MPTPNPYLTGAVSAIQQQSNNNLQQNVLPGINYGAMAGGGFGGSRQRIAQGLAIGQAQQGVDAAAANMYSQAYENDSNRANQMSIASMQDATNRYGIDQTQATALQRLGLDTQVAGWNRDYNQGQLALGNRTADQNFQLGQGQLGVAQQNASTNAQQAANALELGRGQNANQLLGIQNQFTLGQGQLDLGNLQANQGYDIGLRNNALGYTQANNSLQLGQGQLANQAQANQQGFYTQQRGQDLQAAQQQAAMFQQAQQMQLMQALGLYGIGQTEQNAPLNAIGQFSGLLQPYSGLNSSTSQTSPQTGGGWQGAVGGALTLAQIYQMLAGGG